MEIAPEFEDAPSVMLGGKHWAVPLLAVRRGKCVEARNGQTGIAS